MSVEKFIISKESPSFTVIPHDILQGLKNAEALGLWCYLSSLSSSKEVYKSELKKHFSIQEKKLDKLLIFLEESCLINIKYETKENGDQHINSITILDGQDFF